jgi:hypothetical protein
MIENSNPLRIFLVAIILGSGASTTATGSDVPGQGSAYRAQRMNPIVGTWIVKHRNAPFLFHMYVFNADHTMQQANPDAGDAQASDSDGKGVWAEKGDHIVGKWVEIIASRSTHKYSGSGEFTYDIVVNRNTLTGSGSFLSFDADVTRVGRPLPSPFTGTRVTVP